MIDVETDQLRPLGHHHIDTDLSLPYFEHEFARIGEKVKQEQRERILRFILDNHSADEFDHMRFFGFPGAEWKMENMLVDSWTRKVCCIGIERSPQVMEYAIRHMPGTAKERTVWPMRRGEIYGWKSNAATYFHFHAEHFWRLNRSDVLDTVKFSRRFNDWSCAWIDPFCQLHGAFFDALSRIQSEFHPNHKRCPLAVSFAIGHDRWAAGDGETTLDSRVRALERKLNFNWHRQFIVKDAFAYRRNKSSITMGTVMGLAVLKTENW